MQISRILLVTDNLDRSRLIEQAVVDLAVDSIKMISVDDGVLKVVQEFDPCLVVLDVVKPGPSLFEQFAIVQACVPKPVVCFSENGGANLVAKSVEAGFSSFVVNCRAFDRIKDIVEVAVARFVERNALQQELEKVKSKLSSRVVVERAKGLMIEDKGLTEDQAYKVLRKMAMDGGKKISVVANEVCETYFAKVSGG